MSENEVIWESSATDMFCTVACLSFTFSGSSSLARTRHSAFRALGRVPYRLVVSGKLDQLRLEKKVLCIQLLYFVGTVNG